MNRACQTDQIPKDRRQDKHADSPAGHKEKQLVLKVSVQLPPGMVRHIHRGLREIEGCQSRHHGIPGALRARLEQDRGVHRALGNRHFHNAFLGETPSWASR